MTDICMFNSICPCFEENRCKKVVDNECAVRLIEIYSKLHDEHARVLNERLISLQAQCMIQNSVIEKLKKRYPDGFDPERSIHRDR